MTKPITILISAGGTGGGIYPALAVAEGLRRVSPNGEVHFVGSVGGMESDLVPRALFAGYHEVQSGPLHGVGIGRMIISLSKLTVGLVQSLGLVNRIRPDVLFLTGGWVTFPVALACWLCRVPIAIFLPDIEPALAIKTLSRLARIVMTTTGESVSYFPAGTRVLETGYPLREEVISATREQGIAHFSLDLDRKTLLVFGGSRGARSINDALIPIVPDLLADKLQIIHVTGELDYANVQEKAISSDKRLYHSFNYLHHDMGLAMAAAHLVVSRAGASILGEFPYFGLPSILIPYPFAWRYQKINADWLVGRGAAIRLDDEKLSTELLPAIRDLLSNPTKLAEMSTAAKNLTRTDISGEIARQVIRLTSKH